MSGSDIEAEVRRRFAAAVAAFDRGACVEEATAELTPDLYERLPDGPTKHAVRAAFRKLAADPPGAGRESAVRAAHAALSKSGSSKMGSDLNILRERRP